WLQSTYWAIPSVAIVSLWGTIGGTRMIIFLAALQGVPQEMYDAANIDGAGAWRRFVNITLPLISPTMFFNVVLTVIGSLSVFSLAYIATGGGPNYATYFYVYHLFKNAFEFSRMGYAAAMAWVFFLIILVLTLFQFRFSNRWVYYAGADAREETADAKRRPRPARAAGDEPAQADTRPPSRWGRVLRWRGDRLGVLHGPVHLDGAV